MLKELVKGTLNLFTETCMEGIAEFSGNQLVRAEIMRIVRPAAYIIAAELIMITTLAYILLFIL